MRNTFTILSAFLLVFLWSCGSQGPTVLQSDKDLRKATKDDATRAARKEARQKEREGWDVPPGSLPLENVLQKAWEKQYETTEAGQPKYITADGHAVAGNYSAAEMQAIELGKLQLAGLIETRIASLVSANIGNTELSDNEAESVTEVVQSSKNIIAQELGYVNPFFKIRRALDNGNKEVAVRLFYDVEQAMSIAKKAVRKELKEKIKTNEEDLKKLMGM